MTEKPSLYRVTGTAGTPGTPGAPILHFDLLVAAATGKVTGHVSITQAIPPPNGNITLTVSGQVRGAGFGPVTQLVALTGTYPYSLPPPAIGTFMESFSAHFAIDAKWNGRGGFSYGGHDVNDVPVRSE